MHVSKINPKWLLLYKLNVLLRPTAVYGISYCPCALSLIKCLPTYHYLHQIIRILYTKYFKQLIIFIYRLYHSNTTNLLVFKGGINKVTRNYFRPVMPLLCQSFHIDTFGFDLCNNFGDIKYTVQYNILP